MRHPEISLNQLLALSDTFLGQQLGKGVARRVFEMDIFPEYVIKIEAEDLRDWQNIAEWELWHSAKLKLSQYLAPCVWISGDGLVLIQKRCQPMSPHLIPQKVPAVLSDTHDGNWGWLMDPEANPKRPGRPVMFDYGRNLAHYYAQNVAMRFRDEEPQSA